MTEREQAAATAPPQGLSFVETTALTVAHLRALEHARPDRLFEDPHAGAFVAAAGEAGEAARRMPTPPADYFALRTRFFDEFLSKACRGGCRQVVILAAGLDARAFRLDWPEGVRLFEVDLPATLRFKDRVLKGAGAVARCDRRAVEADLREGCSGPLAAAGFVREPTAWLVEGLLFYLEPADASRLVAEVAAVSAPGSCLGVEHVNGATFERLRAVMDALRAGGAPWRSSLDDPGAWFGARGWRAQVCDHHQIGARFGRLLPAQTFGGDEARAWLIEAARG